MLLVVNALFGIIDIVMPGLIINELMVSVENRVWNNFTLLSYLAVFLAIPAIYRGILIPIGNAIFRLDEEIRAC